MICNNVLFESVSLCIAPFYSMSVRRGSQRDKDGMQKNDRMKEAEMRRASMAEMVNIAYF